MGVVWTLSGFLGLPTDWEFLRPLDVRPWPDASNDASIDVNFDADAIVGYSMGGRRALQILESHRFRAAVIVSAGLNAPDEERRAGDEAWARRFESDDWASLMRDWNAQPVFGGHALERREEDYDRAALARTLREWSPAAMPPPRLASIETPILWVAGERDAKYVEIGREAVSRLPDAELWICPGAGHRVPWEQPEAFARRLRAFLDLH